MTSEAVITSQFKQLRNKPKKNVRASMGLDPMASAL